MSQESASPAPGRPRYRAAAGRPGPIEGPLTSGQAAAAAVRVPVARLIGHLTTRPAEVTPTGLTSWRSGLTWMLGLIWLLDAALQYQPYMFTADFPNSVIKAAGQGSPGWVSGPVNWSGDLLASHLVLWNSLFATVQLLIAVGIIWSRTRKLALAGSIVWALLVWWLGEGFGGLLAGPVAPVMGLPGAVLLYAVVAALIWPRDPASGTSVAAASPLRTVGSRSVWLVLWGLFVLESLRPANRTPSALHGMVAGMSDGEPGWIKAIDRWGASLLDHHGTEASILLAIVFAFIALSVLSRPLLGAGVIAAVSISLLIWIVAEDFGGIATGQGTDPNSGLPLALLALCYWPIRQKPGEAALTTSAVAAEGASPGRPPRRHLMTLLVSSRADARWEARRIDSERFGSRLRRPRATGQP